jgi:hypothetical protein
LVLLVFFQFSLLSLDVRFPTVNDSMYNKIYRWKSADGFKVDEVDKML